MKTAYMTKVYRQLTQNILLLVTALVLVENSYAVSVDVRGEYESWQSGLGGTATAVLGGMGVSYLIAPKITFGGGFVTGNYSSDAESDTDISRIDLDLTLSYLIRPLISIYSGYQLIRLDYKNKDDSSRSFNDVLHALGVGAVYYHPLKNQWLAYGGIGFSGVYAASTQKEKNADRGTGVSSSFNLGILYGLSKNSSVAAGIKSRNTAVNYGGDSGSWSHNARRLVVSFSRQW